ncbi:MAG: hypothetical protein ACREQZ_02775 [Woeseiaceae bacterium]
MTRRDTIRVHVGHICLQRAIDGDAERFIRLVEALDAEGVNQHVIAGNADLAKRVSLYRHVSIGPVAASAVVAYCLMPQVDLVHAHGDLAGQAALLLTLTRSIPYIMSRSSGSAPSRNPVFRAVLKRAMAQHTPQDALDVGEILRVYSRAQTKWRDKAKRTKTDQNSQSTPTAGSSGNQ